MRVRILVWGGLLALWLAPAAAMRLTREVHWTGFDFLVWGVMLLLAGGGTEAALRASGGWAYRMGAATAILAVFLTVWSELAVGIIGEAANPANLMFAGVLAVAMGGALLVRLQAAGLARTMWATAAAQAAAGAVALVGRLEAPASILAVTAVFGGLWLAAGMLFARARRSAPPRPAAA